MAWPVDPECAGKHNSFLPKEVCGLGLKSCDYYAYSFGHGLFSEAKFSETEVRTKGPSAAEAVSSAVTSALPPAGQPLQEQPAPGRTCTAQQGGENIPR